MHAAQAMRSRRDEAGYLYPMKNPMNSAVPPSSPPSPPFRAARPITSRQRVAPRHQPRAERGPDGIVVPHTQRHHLRAEHRDRAAPSQPDGSLAP